MPGILPMKVIKVGTSAQSRIAQACDRCRSKKIRCDGITPCCSQCANVGFACKTSDKLSRRAFPRGYTESLEERVRALESEATELKDLLDEKDEKIDILSRIHSNSPSLRRPSSTPSTSPSLPDVKEDVKSARKEHIFRVQQSPCLLDGDESDSYFMGASSGRSFVDTFKAKFQESGRPCSEFKTEACFAIRKKDSPSTKRSSTSIAPRIPSRMVSDQMINIFFQEWAPLFPVVHRPTVLKAYADYVNEPEGVKDNHSLAQLNLIFGIAALSSEWNKQNAQGFEQQWQAALDAVLAENTLPTLQCLALVQIYCIAKADYNKLLHYKGIAISLSHRLGLHQSQKRFSMGALTSEIRKKVFWTLYTLDCFSAALLGLPKLFNESDIHAEYPADVDDENVFERGFQSTLPGEFTRVSSALALFRVARIMSMVLEENYPAASSHDLSLQKIGALNDELDNWLGSLPPHLRLHFVQDKPSTNVVGSRSPLLSLAYHYVRTLIHRPAVGSSLGNKASPSVVALAQSSKHIVQIVQLLEERRMSFSFCLNKNELLLLAGFGLLFQGLNLDRRGKLIQDSQRLLCSVIGILERNAAIGAAELRKVAFAIISVERFSKDARGSDATAARRKSEENMAAPKESSKSARKLQTIASRFSTGNAPVVKRESSSGRRFTAPTLSTGQLSGYDRSTSQNSVSSVVSDPNPQNGYSQHISISQSPGQDPSPDPPNLDYLSFNNPAPSPKNLSPGSSRQFRMSDLSNQQMQPPLDSHFPSEDVFSSYISPPPPDDFGWCSNIWAMPSNVGDQPDASQGRVSFSEEDLTSGEELSSCDTGAEFHGLAMDGLVGLDGLDGNFEL
ncbi:hypothetical protein HO133_004595 [Letharia lupina]|uniref:Zn(2)-C6 fungal-type domain-containing protein n=1 Tax=Letharia lupina TaxID=560253 RepID=A0A8H6FKL5_9LECA|nr:uncharacterized protein HO133_004595 [Letharia lupina]KAF6230255.1 hypothetical protein HO133_004595 [Letharia lupina]